MAYKRGVIAIPSVTGDIVITATAVQSAPEYTNLWKESEASDGYRYNSSGTLTAATGYVASNVFAVPDDGQTHMIYMKGIDFRTSVANRKYVYCSDSTGTMSSKGAATPTGTMDGNGVCAVPVPIYSGSPYAKIAGLRTLPMSDIVVTVDEPIE